MNESVQKTLLIYAKKLGERLAFHRLREKRTAIEVADDLGIAKPSYYRLEKGEPRNPSGWSLLQLLALARIEKVSLTRLLADITGESTRLDELLLNRFHDVPVTDKEALVDELQGTFSFAPMFSKAEWFTRVFLDMVTYYSPAELAKFESDLHTLIMNRTSDEKEHELRSERVIDLTGAYLKLQAEARLQRDQSAKDKRK
jgi:transcriptional regulator with XRE-family HTH domain